MKNNALRSMDCSLTLTLSAMVMVCIIYANGTSYAHSDAPSSTNRNTLAPPSIFSLSDSSEEGSSSVGGKRAKKTYTDLVIRTSIETGNAVKLDLHGDGRFYIPKYIENFKRYKNLDGERRRPDDTGIDPTAAPLTAKEIAQLKRFLSSHLSGSNIPPDTIAIGIILGKALINPADDDSFSVVDTGRRTRTIWFGELFLKDLLNDDNDIADDSLLGRILLHEIMHIVWNYTAEKEHQQKSYKMLAREAQMRADMVMARYKDRNAGPSARLRGLLRTEYAYVNYEKFLAMFTRVKKRLPSPDEEAELERFARALPLMEESIPDLETHDYATFIKHINCGSAAETASRILNGFGIENRIIQNIYYSKLSKPGANNLDIFERNKYIRDLWNPGDSDGLRHEYVIARIAGEFFIIDLSASQFLMEDIDISWFRNNHMDREKADELKAKIVGAAMRSKRIGVCMVPLRDLTGKATKRSSWPYNIGRVFMKYNYPENENIKFIKDDDSALSFLNMHREAGAPEGSDSATRTRIERMIKNMHNDELALIVKAKSHLKNIPVNELIDLSIFPAWVNGLTEREKEEQLNENLETLAWIIAWHNSLGLDIRYKLCHNYDGKFEVEATDILKKRLEHIAALPGVDLDVKRLFELHTGQDVIEIQLRDAGSVSAMPDNYMHEKRFPVALLRDMEGSGICIPNLTGASAIGVSLAALRAAYEKDTSENKADYNDMLRSSFTRIASIYKRNGVKNFKMAALDKIVKVGGEERRNLLFQFALRPIVIDRLIDYHKAIQRLLQDA